MRVFTLEQMRVLSGKKDGMLDQEGQALEGEEGRGDRDGADVSSKDQEDRHAEKRVSQGTCT